MPILTSTPVFFCRHCGKPLAATNVQADTQENFDKAVKNLGKIAVCKPCRRRYEYHNKTGSTDFRLGPEQNAPVKVIYLSREEIEKRRAQA